MQTKVLYSNDTALGTETHISKGRFQKIKLIQEAIILDQISDQLLHNLKFKVHRFGAYELIDFLKLKKPVCMTTIARSEMIITWAKSKI